MLKVHPSKMIFRFENIIMHPERSDLELKIRLFMGLVRYRIRSHSKLSPSKHDRLISEAKSYCKPMR